jgi:hypothetical protein
MSVTRCARDRRLLASFFLTDVVFLREAALVNDISNSPRLRKLGQPFPHENASACVRQAWVARDGGDAKFDETARLVEARHGSNVCPHMQAEAVEPGSRLLDLGATARGSRRGHLVRKIPAPE